MTPVTKPKYKERPMLLDHEVKYSWFVFKDARSERTAARKTCKDRGYLCAKGYCECPDTKKTLDNPKKKE